MRIASDLADQIAGQGAVDLALRLLLLDLLLRPIGHWSIRSLILAAAAAGLLIPGWLRRPALWFALAVSTAVRVVVDWPLADNHAYLLSYWCAAIALSLTSRDPRRSLAHNARLLIGLVFGFAVLWKGVLSPDFLDGTFFRVTMLTDPRFEGWTRVVAGFSVEQLDTHRELLGRHLDAPPHAVEPGPDLSPRLGWIADAMTGWTVVLEFAIAAAFLWWRRDGLARARDALLIAFCATSYAVSTIEGFGWLLISMGVAQCDPGRRTTRMCYLASFALILGYREVPWADFAL